MSTLSYDGKDIASINRAVLYLKAEHITSRIMTILDDFYKDSNVEPSKEIDLEDYILNEIQNTLAHLI